MMKKRIVSLGLAAMMTAGLFAGCGNSSESQGDSTASGSKSDDIVTLKWVTIGSGMPDNYDSWVKKVNDYVGEKIGVNIDMEVVAWGDWDNRRNIIISTNEDYDIIFGNGNVYTSDTKLGAYYDITDLIDDNMPGLKELMPSDYWDAVAIDGKIYAVPTYKDSSLSNYAIWDKEIVDKYNLDIESMTDISSLTDTFKQIKSDTNDYPVYVKNDGLYYIFDTYDQLGAGCQALGVKYNDKDAKVCYTLEQDDIYSELETIHEWYQDGIINPDASTLSEGRVYNVWRVAQHQATMCIFLSIQGINTVMSQLKDGGYPGDTPVAIVVRATWPDQKILRGTIDTIADVIHAEGVVRQAMIVVGRVLDTDYELSKLYDSSFTTMFRQGTDKK